MQQDIFDEVPNEKINPYFLSAELIAQRLMWDLNWRSWHSKKILKTYKNKYKDKKAIILCNGPSLNKTNFEELAKRNDIFFFGLNKVNLLFKRTDFRPNAIVAVNSLVIEQNQDFYNETEIPLFLGYKGKKWVNTRKNIAFVHGAKVMRHFARDCTFSICEGFTVTYVAMQLAFHFGFSDVALIGCDHSFATKGPNNKTVESDKEDHSHFDKNYFAGGVKWQLPDLTGSELHYEYADYMYRAFGRRLINCTDGGKLEILERMALNDFMG